MNIFGFIQADDRLYKTGMPFQTKKPTCGVFKAASTKVSQDK
ncbi:hypothetical protein [Marinilongibacter aquaticus]|nr:hypothetical protein [Marinilongibacter aquaticus]